MRLKVVTITGPDEETPVAELVALAKRFPFLEIACLLSLSRTGHEPRYPHLSYLAELSDAFRLWKMPKLAVHLCGRLARNAADREGYAVEMARAIVPNLRRIQVNLGAQVSEYPDVAHNLSDYGTIHKCGMILQVPSFDHPSVYRVNEDPVLRSLLAKAYADPGLTFLHDGSGGLGISGTWHVPVTDGFVGYAGGLGPDNIETRIQEILAMDAPNDCGIDMEAGVRTNDRLDLAKVSRVLEIAEKYIV